MIVRTILCRCATPLYMGGPVLICPKCKEKIRLIDNEAYMYMDNTPVLNTSKFHSDALKYFQSEYPKTGDKILHIYDNNECDILFWEERFNEIYENMVIENKKPLPFSWKLLTNK